MRPINPKTIQGRARLLMRESCVFHVALIAEQLHSFFPRSPNSYLVRAVHAVRLQETKAGRVKRHCGAGWIYFDPKATLP